MSYFNFMTKFMYTYKKTITTTTLPRTRKHIVFIQINITHLRINLT
jgi:hypothetical protein